MYCPSLFVCSLNLLFVKHLLHLLGLCLHSFSKVFGSSLLSLLWNLFSGRLSTSSLLVALMGFTLYLHFQQTSLSSLFFFFLIHCACILLSAGQDPLPSCWSRSPISVSYCVSDLWDASYSLSSSEILRYALSGQPVSRSTHCFFTEPCTLLVFNRTCVSICDYKFIYFCM